MLDLKRLKRIRLTTKPPGQRLVANLVLTPNYQIPPRVRIELQGFERVPKNSVIYAMNHTDRYNYWPFQYQLHRHHSRYTATWVKGKYYQHRAIGWFMEKTNNIPTVSRGYLIAADFHATIERAPTETEYKTLSGLLRGKSVDLDLIPAELLERGRDVVGYPFDPTQTTYAECVNSLYKEMMTRFVELNREAIDKKLDLLIFPQGTRSIRLSQGRIGLAQIALYLKKTIIPVGCNGSDHVYPGSSPFAKGGSITYRIGRPITYDQMADYHIDEDYQPFTTDAESRWGARFEGLTELVMERINECLDPGYQFAPEGESDGVAGVGRFI